jgi:O-antigen/teichoic acid export membrane protein
MKSSDHLLRHSILLMAASQVSNVSSVLFHMVMGGHYMFMQGHWLTPAEYGVLSSMLGVVLIAGMPLGALGTVLTFFSAQLLQQNRAGDILPLMRVWALKVLLIAGPLLVIGMLFSQPLAEFFKLPDRSALFMALIILAMTFFTPVISAPLGGIQAFGWASVSGMSWGVVRLIVGGVLVYFVAASANGALVGHGVGMIASTGIAIVGLWIILRRALPTGQALPETYAYLGLTIVVMACFSFLMNADILIVKHYFSPDQTGFYARAGTIGRTIIFLPTPIAGALFPKTVSNGDMSAWHIRLLWKALFYTAIIIIPAALVCTLFPQLPLGVLYSDWQPDAAMCRLVRCTIWAMTPLSLAFIIMNFELSQNRFRIAVPLILCMAGYLAGVSIWHASVLQIIAVLAIVSVLALLALVKSLPRQNTPDVTLSAIA